MCSGFFFWFFFGVCMYLCSVLLVFTIYIHISYNFYSVFFLYWEYFQRQWPTCVISTRTASSSHTHKLHNHILEKIHNEFCRYNMILLCLGFYVGFVRTLVQQNEIFINIFEGRSEHKKYWKILSSLSKTLRSWWTINSM